MIFDLFYELVNLLFGGSLDLATISPLFSLFLMLFIFMLSFYFVAWLISRPLAFLRPLYRKLRGFKQ